MERQARLWRRRIPRQGTRERGTGGFEKKQVLVSARVKRRGRDSRRKKESDGVRNLTKKREKHLLDDCKKS